MEKLRKELVDSQEAQKKSERRNSVLKEVLLNVHKSIGPTRFKMGAYLVYINRLRQRYNVLGQEFRQCFRQVFLIFAKPESSRLVFCYSVRTIDWANFWVTPEVNSFAPSVRWST